VREDTGVPPSMPPRGVFFSANDAVLDWTLAFLNSFRASNPDLPLTLIPFDEKSDATRRLSPEYGFDVYEDAAFARLEEIGRRLELGLTAHGPHWFRRFAAFWGPYANFLYLDARQVILAPLDGFLDAPAGYGLDFVHYDTAIDQVYEPGAFRVDLLSKGARGFNSGRWASRRGILTLEELEHFGEQAALHRSNLNSRNTDQAFLNLCVDLKGLKHGHIAELEGDLCTSGWARQPGSIYRDATGSWRLWDHGGLDHKKRMILLHWAGISRKRGLPHTAIFHRYRTMRMTSGRSTAFAAGVANDAVRRAAYAPLRLRAVNRIVHKLK
jgi:hypothetical protein